MRGERLRILFVAPPVDRQMARPASIHLRHADEVHVVDDIRQDDLLNLERRRHEVEQRRVEEVVLHGARRDHVEPLLQPVFLGGHARRSASRRPRPRPVYLPSSALQRGPFGRDLLDFEVQLADPPLQLGHRAGPWLRRSTPRRSATPRSRSGPGRTSPSPSGSRSSRGTAGCRASSILLLQLVDLLLVGRDLLRGLLQLRLELLQPAAIDAAARLLQLRLRHLVFELREAPLRVLPVAVVVVPDHPDDGQEQEQAGRREDDVQEVDVVSVPDALLFSHGCDHTI